MPPLAYYLGDAGVSRLSSVPIDALRDNYRIRTPRKHMILHLNGRSYKCRQLIIRPQVDGTIRYYIREGTRWWVALSIEDNLLDRVPGGILVNGVFVPTQ